MLSVRNLSAGYGPIEIVCAVDMDVAAGECVTLVGWAASGKTTIMRTLAGLQPARVGEMLYEGRNITGLAGHLRVALGIAMVPEGRHIFRGMSVAENLLVGAHTASARTAARQAEFVYELFPLLNQRRSQVAGTLSGGEQQMCAIGRALMSAPRLLLIDELSLGLAPVVVASLVDGLADIRKLGTTIILVEQDIELALSVSDRAYILQHGRIARTGPSAALKADPQIRHEYFAQPKKT